MISEILVANTEPDEEPWEDHDLHLALARAVTFTMRERDTMLENLTATQARLTKTVLECRNLKAAVKALKENARECDQARAQERTRIVRWLLSLFQVGMMHEECKSLVKRILQGEHEKTTLP